MNLPALHRSIKFKITYLDGTVRQIYSRDLRLGFSISKTMSESLNSLQAQIYNLSPESRGKIAHDIDHIQIYFGYLGPEFDLANATDAEYDAKMFQVFDGDFTLVSSRYEPPEWITTITFHDGRKDAYQHFPRSYGPNTPVKTALKDALKKMKKADETIIYSLMKQFDEAVKAVKSGAVDALGLGTKKESFLERGWSSIKRLGEEVSDFAKPIGLNFSIQDGKPEWSLSGKPLEPIGASANVFDFTNGLLTPPERVEIHHSRGEKILGVRFNMMIIEHLVPHYRIRLAGQPDRQIVSVRMAGDSHSPSCYATVEARDLPVE